ncbi:hypothetical protein C9374_007285 [Naegleria lovaniensis]|uniref:Uncharacterized protein n=1 Tax=Naegleria lovaniensis TaxID=51637 RepID=A0AA88H591_NAELO|nr:uncharacterized protein C9374_007285 [Naegleria lovaniensis]KAG2393754.1 hypothetical protein C9374_007285 [Naegleria lovaniensis]
MNGEQEECYLDVLKLKSKLKAVAFNRLKEYSKQYFQILHPEGEISFSIKQGGGQLGVIINVIRRGNENSLRYFIKTHSHGRKESSSSDPIPVQALELIMYKVLEKLQLCPEVHFVCKDAKDFYIATLNAGQDENFHEYSKCIEQPEVLGRHVWVNLLEHFKEGVELDCELDETNVLDEKAHQFVNQMTLLDIIIRVFNIRDVIHNTTNFGFVLPSGDLKIIDVRIEPAQFTKQFPCFFKRKWNV